ncbi:hypothetical protein VTN77DRAFT_6524 [Rasamsonia byssochlamydoides]|uniref:uncharacterized protein n=1 Tax=Rasamsonia byssochlamydoides TaxID=89139 RepID=UPI003742D160
MPMPTLKSTSFFLLSLLSLSPTIYAQYDYSGNSATATTTSAAASSSSSTNVHDVNVGQNGLVFSPDTLTAAVGDKVNFHFYPVNHSVVQSSFDTPCKPITGGGIFSGFVPSSGGVADNMFTITINDTNPIWLYCSQTELSHCQAGMAMVINPPSSGNTLAAYKAAAANTGTSVSPASVEGGVISKNTAPGSSSSSSSTSTTTSSSASPSVNASADELSSGRNWLAVTVSVLISGVWAGMIA